MNPLVIVPTYNERNNVSPLLKKLRALQLPLEILFVDDNSPDGTGKLLDEFAAGQDTLHILHRPSKEGIGAAHLAGLAWAEERGHTCVVTMDCDLTHSPEDIPDLLAAAETADVVVGSRYLQQGSLEGWNWRRKLLTHLAHTLTRTLLALPYDSTGAFRVYRLDRLPPGIFSTVRSMTYPFFFESLLALQLNGAAIAEVPIRLPPRTYGSSKMPPSEPFRGILHLLETALRRITSPESFRRPTRTIERNPALIDAQGWDDYWRQTAQSGNQAYKVIATIYRRLIISRNLNAAIRTTFPSGSRLLHAGCGSGQVDVGFQNEMRITAVDTSICALETYVRAVQGAEDIRHASIFALPFANDTFDGIYNLGVMEHFPADEITAILKEFRRVLKPGGRLLMFWPHSRATSVAVLGFWHTIRKKFFGSSQLLHPPEVSLVRSQSWMADLLKAGGFAMETYRFDWRDFWVQVVVTAEPLPDRGEASRPQVP